MKTYNAIEKLARDNKIEDAPKLTLKELQKRMKPGDIIFQSRVKTLEAGVKPFIASGIMQIGQKEPIMHAAMAGNRKRILDYGTGGVKYLKGKDPGKLGLRSISLKDMAVGKRLIAIGRVEDMDKKERREAVKRFKALAKESKFNVPKSIKVGLNRFLGKKILSQRERGEFCSTIVDKAIDDVNIRGIATPADLLNSKKVSIIGVYDPVAA